MQKHNYEEKDPTFFGAGYNPDRDKIRLTEALQLIYNVLRDENWHTLESISQATGKPEASVSAHIRTLRRPENGGYYIERRHIKDGLHEYKLDHALPTNWKPKQPKTVLGFRWQPIETAPRDGTTIFVACFDEANHWASSDMWDYSNNRWLNNWRCHKRLTHWMPFPPAPKEES